MSFITFTEEDTEVLRCKGLSKGHTRRSSRATNRTAGASNLLQAGGFLLSTCPGGESTSPQRAALSASRPDDFSNFPSVDSKRVSPLISTRHFYPTPSLSHTYILLKHHNDPPMVGIITPRIVNVARSMCPRKSQTEPGLTLHSELGNRGKSLSSHESVQQG